MAPCLHDGVSEAIPHLLQSPALDGGDADRKGRFASLKDSQHLAGFKNFALTNAAEAGPGIVLEPAPP